MKFILSARSVTKSFPVRLGQDVLALRDVELDVAEGELVCLLGASGCGKSTLLNLFAGFIAPSQGEILLRDSPIKGIDPRCGMVFQSYALFPWRTVRRNVEFGPRMKGLPAATCRALSDHFLAMVRLDAFADHYPAELSGGMQQRITLARSLAADPEVLLMDEPFAALDAMTRQALQEELSQIQRTSGKTVVFVTHSIDEALIMADRIVVMSARPGRVTAIIENRLARPRDVDVLISPDAAALKKQIWGNIADDVKRHAA